MLDWQNISSWQVLLIDDEPDNLEVVAESLEFYGIAVETAKNGQLGLEKLETFAPTLILLDLSMPGLSGEETFHELRGINPQVRVVLSSGYSQTEAARRFVNQPVAGFLQKPYDVEMLIAEVWRHLH